MAGIIIFLTITVQQCLHLVDSFNVVGKGEEFTTLLGVVSLACSCYGLIFVGHDNLWITSPERSFGSNHVAFGGIIFPLSAMSIICCIDTG